MIGLTNEFSATYWGRDHLNNSTHMQVEMGRIFSKKILPELGVVESRHTTIDLRYS